MFEDVWRYVWASCGRVDKVNKCISGKISHNFLKLGIASKCLM